MAVQTELGSGPVGPVPLIGAQTTLATHTIHVDYIPQQNKRTLDEWLKSFWELESFGVTQPDRIVLNKFQDSICFVDGRYGVSLPWKDSCPLLPDNHEMS